VIVTPQYDQKAGDYVVDWPGRPEGPVPRFPNFPQARAYADRVERGEVPGGVPWLPTLPAPRPQPQPPKSVFPPLEVSGLGTPAYGLLRSGNTSWPSNPRRGQFHGMVVSDEVRRLIEQHRDPRERPRSSLVP
jgi:hypothetical protein